MNIKAHKKNIQNINNQTNASAIADIDKYETAPQLRTPETRRCSKSAAP
jgi:hypothetical protein